MQTVFSHIIQKRFSQVNEDVATDALAYILGSSESARNGMMKLLRSIVSRSPGIAIQEPNKPKARSALICGVLLTTTHVFSWRTSSGRGSLTISRSRISSKLQPAQKQQCFLSSRLRRANRRYGES